MVSSNFLSQKSVYLKLKLVTIVQNLILSFHHFLNSLFAPPNPLYENGANVCALKLIARALNLFDYSFKVPLLT